MRTIVGSLALRIILVATFFQIKDSETTGEALFGTAIHGIPIVYIAWTLFG